MTGPGSLVQRSLIAVASGLFGVLFSALLLGPGVSSPLAWLSGGIVSAIVLRWGWSTATWALLGVAVAAATVGRDAFNVATGVIGAAVAALGLDLATRLFRFERDFASRNDFLRFALAVAVATTAPALVTLVGAFGARFEPAMQSPGYYLLRWWLSASVAMLAVVPGYLVASRATLADWWRERTTALALLAATAALAAVLLGVPTVGGSWVPLLAIPLVAYSTLRMGLPFSALIVLALTATSAVETTTAAQAAGRMTTAAETARIWSLCLVLTGVVLTLRALLSEREAVQRRLRAAQARYRIGLLDAAMREQERIGRDVREALGRNLATLARRLEALDAQARTAAPAILPDVRDMSATCQRAIEASWALAEGMTPEIAPDGDYVAALRRLAARVPAAAGMEVAVEAAADVTLAAEPGRDVYRIVQEALNNALKHARARRVVLRLARDARGGLEVIIEDDGRGLDPMAAHGGLGLRTMQYRAEVAGGSLQIDSLPRGGTRVTCRLPPPAAGGTPEHGSPRPAPPEALPTLPLRSPG